MRNIENVMKRMLIAIIVGIASVAVMVACANPKSETLDETGITPVLASQIPIVGMMVCVECHSLQTASWLTGHGANNSHRSYPLSSSCQPCHDELGQGYSLYPAVFSDEPRPTVACESCHGGGANHYGIGPIAYPTPGYEICGKCHNSEHHSSMTLLEEYTERIPEGRGHLFSINSHVMGDDGTVRARCARCHTNEGFKDYVFQVPGSTGHDDLVDIFADIPNYLGSAVTPVQCGTCHNAHLSTTGDPALYIPGSASGSAEFNTCTSCHQMYDPEGPSSSTITADAANVGDDRVYVEGAYSGSTASSWTVEVTLGGAFGVGEITIYETATPANIIYGPYAPTGSRTSWVDLAENVEFRIRDGSPTVSAGLILGDMWVIDNQPFASYHDPAVNTYGNFEEIIADSHAAVPGDIRQNTGPNAVPLIFVKKMDDNACSACHNVHSTSIEINEDWAESGHGALELPDGDPWLHYNWKSEGAAGTPVGPGSDRTSCQRCHTATGAMNYFEDPAAYVADDNDFSYLIMGTENGSGLDNGQLEVLYCWACHSDAQTGDLREPGPITSDLLAMDNSFISFDNPNDPGEGYYGSNICISCHTGREAGGGIWNSADDFSDTGFKNSHYLAAGSIVLKAGGFTYDVVEPLLDYANVAYFEHDLIGSDMAPDTGENGPCVSCHMQSDSGHTFDVVEKDVTGMITAINSTACVECHTGAYELTATVLNDEKHHYHDALEALKIQLEGNDFYFLPNYPYFFTVPGGGFANAVKNWLTDTDGDTVPDVASGKPNMGAAFNYNLLEHDPGAFAHNRIYTKRLMYDSIDWLDDFLMNDSVKATLNAAPHAGAPYQANAISYLLNDAACTPATDCRP